MKRKDKILVIEDDIELNKGLCKALRTENRELISCFNLQEARKRLLFDMVDLVLLDINLPDGNGMDFLREIKETYSDVLIVILTANDTDLDIVNGLESGADDYITKPFSLSVLRARINTQLRKMEDAQNSMISVEHYSFDFLNQKFFVHGLPVELSKTEQRLLHIFTLHPNSTLTRERLIEYIWDRTDYIDENSLSVAVKRLRDKLNAGNYIQTVYGIGYRWVIK